LGKGIGKWSEREWKGTREWWGGRKRKRREGRERGKGMGEGKTRIHNFIKAPPPAMNQVD